jgi:hypothetical protein
MDFFSFTFWSVVDYEALFTFVITQDYQETLPEDIFCYYINLLYLCQIIRNMLHCNIFVYLILCAEAANLWSSTPLQKKRNHNLTQMVAQLDCDCYL